MPKRKAAPKVPSAENDAWLSHLSGRQEERRPAAPPDAAASALAWLRAAGVGDSTAASSSSGPARASDSPPRQEPDYSSVHRGTGFRVHRETGLLATGFEPQRHCTFVEGRPVQVPSYLSSWGPHGNRCFLVLCPARMSLSPPRGVQETACALCDSYDFE